MRVPVLQRIMLSRRRRTTVLFSTLMLLQVLSPIAFVSAQETNPAPETDADLEALAQLGITPTATAEYGWLPTDSGSDVSRLIYRDVTLVAPVDWEDRTGESVVDGFHILSHAYPVPSDWHGQLTSAGIECFSFLPPTGFHCDVAGVSPARLTALNVQGMARMDAVDKVQMDLVRGMAGLEMAAPNPEFHAIAW